MNLLCMVQPASRESNSLESALPSAWPSRGEKIQKQVDVLGIALVESHKTSSDVRSATAHLVCKRADNVTDNARARKTRCSTNAQRHHTRTPRTWTLMRYRVLCEAVGYWAS